MTENNIKSNNNKEEEEETPFDLENYDFTDEAYEEIYEGVMRKYFPSPANGFISCDSVRMYYERLERIGRKYNNEHEMEEEEEKEDNSYRPDIFDAEENDGKTVENNIKSNNNNNEEEEETPFDLENYDFTDEMYEEIYEGVMRKYFPSPANGFISFDSVHVYYERLKRIGRKYKNEHERKEEEDNSYNNNEEFDEDEKRMKQMITTTTTIEKKFDDDEEKITEDVDDHHEMVEEEEKDNSCRRPDIFDAEENDDGKTVENNNKNKNNEEFDLENYQFPEEHYERILEQVVGKRRVIGNSEFHRRFVEEDSESDEEESDKEEVD